MKTNQDRMVLVVARTGTNLVKLSSGEGPMMVPCGVIGPMIASKVLNGSGSALVSASEIRLAIDTTDGMNALLDNFDLLDEHTRGPLLHSLLKSL